MKKKIALEENKKMAAKGSYLVVLLLLIVGALMDSCNSDFLEDDYLPEVIPTTDTLFITSEMQSVSVDIDMGQGNRSWRVFQYPKWFDISPREGKTTGNSVVTFNLELVDRGYFEIYGVYLFPLVIEVDGVGLVERTIAYFDFGNPSIYAFPKSLNLKTELSGDIRISNQGDGILVWEVTHKPDWLYFEAKSDVYYSYSMVPYKYEALVDGLEPGVYTDNIVIKNNANNELIIPVTLTIEDPGPNGVYFDGELLGSKYLKTAGKLMVLTKNPNRLLFFSTMEDEPEIRELDRVPLNLSVLEDETKLAVSFSNTEISVYDLPDVSLQHTYKINALPVNIEFASKEHLCYLSTVGYDIQFHSLDLNNGAIKVSDYHDRGLIPLKKVPGKSVMLSSKPDWGPEFLFFFYLNNQGEAEKMNQYRMNPKGFWFSEDGQRIFTGSQKVFQVPRFNPDLDPWKDEHPPLLGMFELGQNRMVRSIAHQSSRQRFFVASQEGYNTKKTHITQFHHSTYVKQKNYELSSIPPKGFPKGQTWWENTVDIYPDKGGSNLWVVQEYPNANSSKHNIWSVRNLKLDELK